MKWSRAWNGIEYLDMDKGLRPKAKGARKLSREFTRVLPEEVRRDALYLFSVIGRIAADFSAEFYF
jgi:hypothetical protein